jgi:hypothetical protein
MDDTWGLSWSRRWHAIDAQRHADMVYGGAISRCGKPVYSQDKIRSSTYLWHLKAVLAEPGNAAGICKRCTKAAE